MAVDGYLRHSQALITASPSVGAHTESRHATHMHGTGKQKATHLTQGGIVEAPGKGQTVRWYDPAERQKVLLLLLASPPMAMWAVCFQTQKIKNVQVLGWTV